MPHRDVASPRTGAGTWQFASQPYQTQFGVGHPPPGAPDGRKPRGRLALQPRHLVVLACFLATLTAYVERVGFSIAFTAMAREAGTDEGVTGTVLSAFYWGYGVSQIPGGWAAQRWGGERVLGASFAAWSLASLATPGSAASPRAVAAARVCVGLAQGFLIPAVHTVLAAWVPPTERARAVSLATSGMYLGAAGAMLALPSLAAALGPAALLRLVGCLGLAWLAGWRLALARVRAAAAAAAMPRHGGDVEASKGRGKRGRGAPTPWRAMLAHPAVWAIVANNFAFHYAFYLILAWLPTYFDRVPRRRRPPLSTRREAPPAAPPRAPGRAAPARPRRRRPQVLHASLASLGATKALPYLLTFAASNAGGWASDHAINARRRSVAAGRKLVNTAGFCSAAAALLLMPGARSPAAGVAFTSLALGCAGFSRGGFAVNHMDVAPRYAGALMGISNTAGTLAGVVGVSATGYLLQWAGGAGAAAGWYRALAAAAALCVGGAAFFLGAARGERLFGGDAAADL